MDSLGFFETLKTFSRISWDFQDLLGHFRHFHRSFGMFLGTFGTISRIFNHLWAIFMDLSNSWLDHCSISHPVFGSFKMLRPISETICRDPPSSSKRSQKKISKKYQKNIKKKKILRPFLGVEFDCGFPFCVVSGWLIQRPPFTKWPAPNVHQSHVNWYTDQFSTSAVAHVVTFVRCSSTSFGCQSLPFWCLRSAGVHLNQWHQFSFKVQLVGALSLVRSPVANSVDSVNCLFFF